MKAKSGGRSSCHCTLSCTLANPNGELKSVRRNRLLRIACRIKLTINSGSAPTILDSNAGKSHGEAKKASSMPIVDLIED